MSPIKSENLISSSRGSTAAATSPSESIVDAKPPSRKRRASASGSRGIANLTPEQLAKKRANDREAQRAIRERTKHQIESLENQIRELKCQQPYQDLQHVIRQKEAVEAENAEIKRRLSSILDILQPLLADRTPVITVITPSHQDDHIATEQLNQATQRLSHSRLPPIASNTPHEERTALHTRSPPISVSSEANWQTPGTAAESSPGSSAVAWQNTLDKQRALAASISAERLAYTFYPTGHHNILNNTPQGRYRGLGRPALPADSHIILTASHSESPDSRLGHNVQGGAVTPATTLPPNIASTCPLDGLLLDFREERKQCMAQGMSESDIIGPSHPSYYCLFQPERGIYTHALSRFFTDILATFPDIKTPPEQVAVLYVMFRVMRWHISPTQETYDALPEWSKPSSYQLCHMHPAWIDHLPWPQLRDKLVSSYPLVPFDNFFIPYTTTLSLNWPYEPRSILQPIPDSDELALNPVFEEHLRDLKNWSLGPAFAKAHPTLAETVRIKE